MSIPHIWHKTGANYSLKGFYLAFSTMAFSNNMGIANQAIGERDNSVYGLRAGSQGWKGEDGKAKTQW